MACCANSHMSDNNSSEAKPLGDVRPGYLNSHLLFRITRQLTQAGKPLPPAVLLSVQDRKCDQLVLVGALSVTRKNNLTYWPPIPARIMRAGPREECVIDHATLCVTSGKSHLTGYDADDERCRPKQLKSGLLPVSGVGYRLWLVVVLQWEVMRNELGLFEGWSKAPHAGEKRRRSEEIASFVHSMPTWQLALAHAAEDGDFVVLEVALVDPAQTVPTTVSAFGQLDAQVEGLRVPSEVGVSVREIGAVRVAIRTFLPGGRLQAPVLLALPRPLRSTSNPPA